MNDRSMSWSQSRALKSSSAALAVGLVLGAAGSFTSPACGQGLGADGRWINEPNWPLAAEHAIHLPSGEILVWSSGNNARLWDPATGDFEQVSSGGLIFSCSGHAALADGSVLIAGGEDNDDPTSTAAIYDAVTGWRSTGSMAFGRWYPTLTTLGDGRVLVTGGTKAGVPVTPPEIYDPFTETWSDVLVSPGPNPPPGVYPFMFLTPTGTVFYAGSFPNNSLQTWELDLSLPRWLSVDSNDDLGGRPAAAVMYSPGRVLKSGGAAPGDLSEFINLNDVDPTWEPGPDLNSPRRLTNLVMMADGRALAVAGQKMCGTEGCENGPNGDPPGDCEIGCARYKTEWINAEDLGTPAAVWETLADIPVGQERANHATAVLLQNAKVLSAGENAAKVDTATIFEPPYLFKPDDSDADRPLIASAPGVIGYVNTFQVDVANSPVPVGQIDKVTLVRLTAVTHSFDQDQRFQSLAHVPIGGTDTLDVTAPTCPNDAPPGYYMLFVVSDTGAPSEAEYVKLVLCEGDIDGDGAVGIVDFLALLANWGPSAAPCPGGVTFRL